MRIILHSDINNCYASIEALFHPELKNVPFVVGGDEKQRHGIVLAKNYPAKAYGIITGEPLLEARKKCPDLKVLPPNMELYMKYCSLTRQIYEHYTDQIEPFGMDECWLDTTGSLSLFGDGEKIANEIRCRVKEEIGITVSVGVSFNKVFAKLGSDYKKPNAVTVISPENFKNIVWPLPAKELLYVGPATAKKLYSYAVFTIGDLAIAPPKMLVSLLGKPGQYLHAFANGLDASPVMKSDYVRPIKSIGNSTTPPRDLKTADDVRIVFTMLCESVGERLRKHGLLCNGVQISLRDTSLYRFERQLKLKRPTNLSQDICKAAMSLFYDSYRFYRPLRSIGVRAIDLVKDKTCIQLFMLEDENKRLKLESLENTIDSLRERFGSKCILRAVTMSDNTLIHSSPNPLPDSVFRMH